MINRIAFYDMDGTLMDSPLPEQGKPHWKEVTGEDYPHAGWWGRAESLDTDIFDIKPFPSVLNQLKNDMARPDTRTVLLTNRIERLRPTIMNLLKKNGITLDDYNLKKGGEEKDTRIQNYLDKYPSVKEVAFYDDREQELELVKGLKERMRDRVRIDIYQANKGNLSLVESNNKVKSIIVDEISKFAYL